VFCSLLGKRVLSVKQRVQIKVLGNKYSVVRKWRNINTRPPFLKVRVFKKYQYSVFFKRLVFNLRELPFRRRKALKRLILRNRSFTFRRRKKKLRFRNKFFKVKKLKYSFFFLKFRKRRYKRRSSKSPSRKFFTNLWLVAFIFTKPIRIKKL
jgi:hypothetical protein